MFSISVELEIIEVLDNLREIVARVEPKVIGYRRDFHRYAEAGWTEFRTASLVARHLTDLGYEVLVGPEVIRAEERMGLPPGKMLEAHWQRAVQQGGDPTFLPAIKGGFPGVVGVLRHGKGPIVALRFDMDALDIVECVEEGHRPADEGFASVNVGVMHACGHDAHTAIGLGIAEVLQGVEEHIQGTVKLVFQPAEEGVRGAKSMVAAGVLDDVDYLFGHHLMSGWLVGEIACGLGGYAATRKFDARIAGVPAHAGASPEQGRNALVAGATAVLNLYGIPRHGGGATRVNVGRLDAGTGRNIIPPSATMAIETRGASTKLNDYMYEQAISILQAAAAMNGCNVEITQMGAAPTADGDPALAERVRCIAGKLGGFVCHLSFQSGGSEDITHMMRRVQERGGQATVIGIGADLKGIGLHDALGRERVLCAHTPWFDIDERALSRAVMLLSALVLDTMNQPG